MLKSYRIIPGVKYRPKSTVTREFRFGVKFLITTRVGKIWCHFSVFFYFISPRGENIFAKICGIFYKCFTEKDFSYAVTGLYKNYDVRYHQQCLILKLLK